MARKNINKTKRVMAEATRIKGTFTKKIKTAEEVRKLIGKRPRKNKVVMCHGTFDIVHPGHIRQLIYAKTKGDILIISITVDKYVAKRPISPYVPHELRALNIAAFEIVDYVIIDKNPTPIANILKLQPDVFIKGFEYTLKGIHPPRTQEEIKALESYGGEMVFSPGDIVYSSSKLLKFHKPTLSLDHLSTLMSEEGITFGMLKSTIRKFKNIKVQVVGDTIVDKYSKTTVLAATPKTSAFEVKIDETEQFAGGAAVVAKHLRSLGAKTILTTVLGKDACARFVVQNLKSGGVNINAIIDSKRPTTIKERCLDGNNRLLLQIDTIDHSPIAKTALEKIQNFLKLKTDAVILSDFRHGIFNPETIPAIINSIPKRALKVSDTQINHRWGNILDFPHFDLITPNEREARYALADQDTTIRPLAQKLYNTAGCRYLILKLGENGTITYRSPGMDIREYFYIDSFVENVIDPVGAGDALLATATLALAVSGDIVRASILGSLAAAYECSRVGNIPISAEELLEAVTNIEKKIGHV